ncbi:MAG: type II secretion system protein GspG [Bdellovibrionales bacterium]|nr:type II secretion system protein GspG [Bdellovibrionales bacterium]
MIFCSSKNFHGFTLIEVLMTMVLLSILAFASLELMGDSLDETRYEQTLQKMERMKIALIGDPTVRENGVRTSFGYVGDVGKLPDSTQGLMALVSRPSVAPTPEVGAYEMVPSVRFGAGWNGPYLFSASGSADTLLDAWGNTIQYDPSASPPRIRSLGADGVEDSVGGSSGYKKDIIVELPSELWQGTVYGSLNLRGSPYRGAASVILNRPNLTWAVPSPVVTSETQELPDYTVATPSPGVAVGQFQFSGVPFGKRSITVIVPRPSPTPTMTIGPVIFTMDRKNIELSEDSFDVSNP